MWKDSIQLLTPNLVQGQDGGFTAFYDEYPNVLAEGETEEEARKNLAATLEVVLEHEGQLP